MQFFIFYALQSGFLNNFLYILHQWKLRLNASISHISVFNLKFLEQIIYLECGQERVSRGLVRCPLILQICLWPVAFMSLIRHPRNMPLELTGWNKTLKTVGTVLYLALMWENILVSSRLVIRNQFEIYGFMVYNFQEYRHKSNRICSYITIKL